MGFDWKEIKIFCRGLECVLVWKLLYIIWPGRPSWDCTLYEGGSEKSAKEVPRGSTELFADFIWSKIGTCDRWEVFDVCTRPEFTSNATKSELEL